VLKSAGGIGSDVVGGEMLATIGAERSGAELDAEGFDKAQKVTTRVLRVVGEEIGHKTA